MTVMLPIGEFSRMTYLTVKALRHYHEVGVLEPADIDQSNGYRLYSTDQVPAALLISRLRDLEMPLDDVRAMLHAADLATRNEIILAHLQRMEDRLERTQETVASLRSLLEVRPPLVVDYRRLEGVRTLAIGGDITSEECSDWLEVAFDELDQAAIKFDLLPAGSSGAIYSNAFFENWSGEVIAFLPVAGELGSGLPGRVGSLTLPDGDFAIALHHGAFTDIDQTYAALGTYVAERGIRGEGPIREHYLVSDRDHAELQQTEVCWPVTSISVTSTS